MSFRNHIVAGPAGIHGLATSLNDLALPNGYAKLLNNLRLHTSELEARSGDFPYDSLLPGEPRGAFEHTIDGVKFLIVARYISEGDQTCIFCSSDGGASFSEITAQFGPFGCTRFDGDQTCPLRFQLIYSPGISALHYMDSDVAIQGVDLLLIQNGDQFPRVWALASPLTSAFEPGTHNISKLSAIAPLDNSKSFIEHYPKRSIDLGHGFGFSAFVNDVGITTSQIGIGPSNFKIEISIAPTYDGGFSKLIFAEGLEVSDVSQVALVGFSSDDEDFWRKVGLEFYDGVNWTAGFSPNQLSGVIFAGIDTESSRAHENWIRIGISLSNISRIEGIRVKWYGEIPSVDQIKGYLVVFSASGSIQGGASFVLAYASSDNRMIGPCSSVVPRRKVAVSRWGGSTDYSDVLLDDDPRFSYSYYIKFPNAGLTEEEVTNGPAQDFLFWYRRDYGEENFYLAGAERIAQWSTDHWTVSTPYPSAVDSLGLKNYSEEVAGPDVIPFPVGTAMVSANSRLFVGSGSRLYFSDFNHPLRFRQAVRFLSNGTADPLSGGSLLFGGETIQAVVPSGSLAGAAEQLSTPISGATTIHVLTDRNLYQLSGFDSTSLSRPIPVAPYGTLSPMSVGRSRTGFYWLDDRGQVCFFSPQGLSRLSLGLVDDMTTTIPADRKAWVWGACANDRYYLAFTPKGETANNKILVWNEKLTAWESVDTAATPAQALVPFYSEGYVKLLRFSDNGLAEHEQPGNRSPVDFAVKFRELTADISAGPKRLAAGAMTVWADGSEDGYTLTCRRYDPSTGETADGTIEVSGTQRQILIDSPGIGIEGDSIQPSIFGTVPGGTRIHAVWLNLSSAPSGAVGE